MLFLFFSAFVFLSASHTVQSAQTPTFFELRIISQQSVRNRVIVVATSTLNLNFKN